jgi:hypothetical protein
MDASLRAREPRSRDSAEDTHAARRAGRHGRRAGRSGREAGNLFLAGRPDHPRAALPACCSPVAGRIAQLTWLGRRRRRGDRLAATLAVILPSRRFAGWGRGCIPAPAAQVTLETRAMGRRPRVRRLSRRGNRAAAMSSSPGASAHRRTAGCAGARHGTRPPLECARVDRTRFDSSGAGRARGFESTLNCFQSPSLAAGPHCAAATALRSPRHPAPGSAAVPQAHKRPLRGASARGLILAPSSAPSPSASRRRRRGDSRPAKPRHPAHPHLLLPPSAQGAASAAFTSTPAISTVPGSRVRQGGPGRAGAGMGAAAKPSSPAQLHGGGRPLHPRRVQHPRPRLLLPPGMTPGSAPAPFETRYPRQRPPIRRAVICGRRRGNPRRRQVHHPRPRSSLRRVDA